MADEKLPGTPPPDDGNARGKTATPPLGSHLLQAEENPNLICGVDRALIENFLYLIQQNYKRADMATFFLEQRRGVVNFQGITNVRDVLSHLVTLLDPNTPPERQAEQIHNAEEHLRRAINEPYEVALNELVVEVKELYQKYKETVLPIKESYPALANAPGAHDVDAIIQRANDLMARGRSTKSKNMWNEEWEEGVISFTEAYEQLFDLHRTLEMFYNQARQILAQREEAVTITNLQGTIQNLEGELVEVRKQVLAEGRTGKFLHMGGYAIAILGIIIAILLVIVVEVVKYILHN